MYDICANYPNMRFCQLVANVFVYGLLRGLATNLANKNRIENP
jgi:hypothetical protein